MNHKRFQPCLIHLNAVDSTNNYAANLLKETNVVNGTTILTKRQEKGRGQRGNSWHTSPDKNLIFSTITFPQIEGQAVFYLNIAASLAIHKTLEDLGIQAHIKWPNDVYVGDKKICGILIENQLQGSKVASAIIGIGLNVNEEDFPEDLSATSITLEKGIVPDVMDVFEQVYAYLDFYMDHLMNSNFDLLLRRYYKTMYRKDEWHNYKDAEGTFKAKIIGIDEIGRLKLQLETNQVRVYQMQEVKYC